MPEEKESWTPGKKKRVTIEGICGTPSYQAPEILRGLPYD
jgi:serine/threonine protein kinase